MTEFHVDDMTPDNAAWVAYNVRAMLYRCRSATDPIGCLEREASSQRAIAATIKDPRKLSERLSYAKAAEEALAEVLKAQ